MTTRSTRNKLRHQIERVLNDLDRCLGHLKFLSDLSEGQSDYIETHLPGLVFMVEGIKSVMKKFREGL